MMHNIENFIKIFPKGSLIFREGEPGDSMFFIESGKVKILKKIRGGEKVLTILQRGDFFGEMAILTGKPRTASAEAMSDVKVLEIKKDFFEEFLKTNVDVAIKLIKKMAERLRETDMLLEMANLKDDRVKVTLALLQLAEESGSDGEVEIDPVELHSRSFTTTELLKDALRVLSSRNLIKVQDKTIIIPSVERLQKFHQFLLLKSEFSFIDEGG